MKKERAEKYMHNSIGDPYFVFIMAKKNYVNQWSTTTLDNARKSIKLFFEQEKLLRTKAVIKDKQFNFVEEITK